MVLHVEAQKSSSQSENIYGDINRTYILVGRDPQTHKIVILVITDLTDFLMNRFGIKLVTSPEQEESTSGVKPNAQTNRHARADVHALIGNTFSCFRW